MSIRELENGRYQLIVSGKDNFGKRVRKTKVVEAKGPRELNKLYKDFERECEDKPLADTCTVKQLLDSYIEQRKLLGASHNTIVGYEVASKRVISAFGGTLAKDLTPYAIEQFITEKTKKLASKTINNSVNLLSAAYKNAVKKKLLFENPCEVIEKPKKKNNEKKILNEDEIKRFIECLDEECLDFKVLCELALFLGMRKGEILGLRESDINFDFGTVQIQRARYEGAKGEIIIQPPKTERSKRTLVAPEFLLEDIRELIKEHDSPDDYLIQYCGKPMHYAYVEYRFIKFRDRNNFDITLHGLRHTFASMLNADGDFDIAEISSALGHSNITITLNTYTHTFKNANKSVNRIANSMEKWRKNGADEKIKTAEA